MNGLVTKVWRQASTNPLMWVMQHAPDFDEFLVKGYGLSPARGPAWMHSRTVRELEGADLIILNFLGGEFVGYCSVVQNPETVGEGYVSGAICAGYLKGIVVKFSHRRQGICTAMLRHLRLLGYGVLGCFTHSMPLVRAFQRVFPVQTFGEVLAGDYEVTDASAIWELVDAHNKWIVSLDPSLWEASGFFWCPSDQLPSYAIGEDDPDLFSLEGKIFSSVGTILWDAQQLACLGALTGDYPSAIAPLVGITT